MAVERFPHDQLIEGLSRDLRPVRILPSPWFRAFVWIVLVAVATLVLARFGDTATLRQRIAEVPEVGWAMLGSALTAVLAAIAAFQTSIPGRGRRWGLLPLPAVVLWVVTSGLGCLSTAVEEGAEPASLRTAMRDCLPFLLMVSVPLSAVLMLMLRRGFPTRPGHTAALAGMAAAAAAATLLNFFHPFDVAAIDLLVHGAAVAAVVVASRGLGQRWLGGLGA